MTVKKVPLSSRLQGEDDDVKGFRYYLSRPYVMVQAQVPITTEYDVASVHESVNGEKVLVSLIPDLATKQKRYYNLKGELIAPVPLVVEKKKDDNAPSTQAFPSKLPSVPAPQIGHAQVAYFAQLAPPAPADGSINLSDYKPVIKALLNTLKEALQGSDPNSDLQTAVKQLGMDVDSRVDSVIDNPTVFDAEVFSVAKIESTQSAKVDKIRESVGQLRLVLCVSKDSSFKKELDALLVLGTTAANKVPGAVKTALVPEVNTKGDDACKAIVSDYKLDDANVAEKTTDEKKRDDGGSANGKIEVDLNVPENIKLTVLTGTVPGGGGGGSVDAFQVAFLPDFEEQMAVQHCNFAAYGKYDMHFSDGWQMHNVNGSWDSTEVPARILQSISNLFSASAEVEKARQEQIPPTPAEIQQRREEFNRALFDAQVNDQQILLITRTTAIEPGVYRIRKWSDDRWSCGINSTEAVCGLLSEMGMPITESVRVDLIPQ